MVHEIPLGREGRRRGIRIDDAGDTGPLRPPEGLDVALADQARAEDGDAKRLRRNFTVPCLFELFRAAAFYAKELRLREGMSTAWLAGCEDRRRRAGAGESPG